MRSGIVTTLLVLAGGWVITAPPVRAHEGPPFPIVVDRPVGPYIVSVWADPDIGIGTFHIMLDAAEGAAFVQPAAVRIGVRPMSGRLDEVVHDAHGGDVRRGARYMVEVPFDSGGSWSVRVMIESPAGGGELLTEVEPTPDGVLGPIGLVVYALPFVLLALVWWRAAAARRRPSARSRGPTGADAAPSNSA